jgi:hypothetical protein
MQKQKIISSVDIATVLCLNNILINLSTSYAAPKKTPKRADIPTLYNSLYKKSAII